jgi:hypothetical protein
MPKPAPIEYPCGSSTPQTTRATLLAYLFTAWILYAQRSFTPPPKEASHAKTT